MWIRTKDGWYIHEVRGVCFFTWVSEAEREHAARFPLAAIDAWVDLMSKATGMQLEAVTPNVF